MNIGKVNTSRTGRLTTLATLCRRYGTVSYVAGGGGNVSMKDTDTIWIKASGTALAQVDESTLVAVDRRSLRPLYSGLLSEDHEARESLAEQIVADAVLRTNGHGRPSVETPLHDLFSASYVVHTHPPLVNGMTCARDGESVSRNLFPDALWIPYTDPGVTLFLHVKRLFEEYFRERNHEPSILVMQNHGLVVASDDREEIDRIHDRICRALKRAYARAGVDAELQERDFRETSIPDLLNRVGVEPSVYQAFSCSDLHPAPRPLTPDHIVYGGVAPLDGTIDGGAADYKKQFGSDPKLLTHDGVVYGLGKSVSEARLALELAADGERVLNLTRAFGGPKFMPEPHWRFVVNWEAEVYRQKVARDFTSAQVSR